MEGPLEQPVPPVRSPKKSGAQHTQSSASSLPDGCGTQRGGRKRGQRPGSRLCPKAPTRLAPTDGVHGRGGGAPFMSVLLLPQGNDLKRPPGPDLSPHCLCRPPGPDCAEGTGTHLTSLPAPPASLETGRLQGLRGEDSWLRGRSWRSADLRSRPNSAPQELGGRGVVSGLLVSAPLSLSCPTCISRSPLSGWW